MKDRSRYVFGAALAGAAFGAPGLVEQAHGAVVTAAAFSFESLASNFSATASSFGPILADAGGVGSAFGVHTAVIGTVTSSSSPTATVFSSPAGSGSLRSFSANHFGVGDYYEFDVPTTALTGLTVAFDQVSSTTGPSQFALAVSADGSSYTTVGGYTIPFLSASGTNSTGGTTSGTTGFATGTTNAALHFAFDLSAFTALENDASAAFRLVDAGTVGLSGGSVAGTGTDRVDNFVLSGNAATGVPEPTTLSLAAAGTAGLLLRRRNARA